MTLPQAEQQLKAVLGSRFKDSDWSPALDAVMKAEGDAAQASAAIERLAGRCIEPRLTIKLPARASQSISAEQELMENVDELRKRRRIFGTPLTLEEIIDPAEERLEIASSGSDFEGVKDLDGAIINQVNHEGAVSRGEVVEIESDESDEEDEDLEMTKAEFSDLCARMEKLTLHLGAETEYDDVLGLTTRLRGFRAHINRQRQLTAKQTSLDDYFGSSK